MVYFTIEFQQLRKDKASIREAVNHNSYFLEFTPMKRTTVEIVKELGKQNCFCSQFASPELIVERKILMKVINGTGFAYRHVVDKLCWDRDVIIVAVRDGGQVSLCSLEKLLKKDEILS